MKPTRFLLPLIALLLLAAGAAHADSKVKLYKWVDKDGITHYGSSIPPEYAAQQSEEINAQGEVIKTQAAQKTPQEIAAEAAAQQQAQQQQHAAAEQKIHDQVLLDTYSSVSDIERDRDSKLSAIDTQINVLNGNIASVENALADFQGRANDLASKNKPVPADLQKRIDNSKQQLLLNQQELLQQQKEKQQMADQFKADIARYQALTAPAAADSGG